MKKFTLFIASLFIAIGAMAQVTTIDTAKTYTLECNSSGDHNTTRFIGVTDGVIDGKSATGAEITFEAAGDNYYIKVDGKYINYNGSALVASTEASTAWVLGTVENFVTFMVPGTTLYLNNNQAGVQGDGTITNLKANSHPSGPTASNACSTWALVEYVAPEEGGEEETTDLTDKNIASIGAAATSITEGGWYILNNVGRGNIVCEETTAMKMRATNSVAEGSSAVDVAGYLFKITKASDGSHYNIMSGNGKYFALGKNTASISETPVNFVIGHQDETNAPGVFYMYDDDNKYCADGQETGYNFVGWSETFSTSTIGNDAYRLLPVTLADVSSMIVVTYNFTYGGETQFTQTAEGAIGAEFPAINITLPFGVTATKPAGTVSAENATQYIELSLNLPFVPAESYETIEHWYYLNIAAAGKYLYHTADAEYIELSKTAVDASNKDAYTWGFIGNPFDGYKIVNYAAGNGMILSSATDVAGSDEGGSVYPVMMNETELPEGNNTLWIATTSSNRSGVTGFYLAQKDNASNRMNNRSDKLAYWTGSADAGSTFAVIERPMGAVAELEALVAEITAANIVAGENIGDYSAASVDALNAAVEAANAVIEAETATESDVTELQAAYDALAINLPATNKVYAFNVYYNGFGTYMYSKIDGSSTNIYTRGESKDDTKALWQFVAVEGGYNIKNVHTGLFIGEGVTMTDDANNYALFEITKTNVENGTSNSAEEGKVFIKFAGETNYHCLHSYNRETVISWEGSGLGNQIGIEEVSEFSHTLTVSDAGLATLMLGFNTTIPEGVECYYATEAIDERGVLNLTQVDGNVLPANTPVIVKAAANDYEFAYTDAAATAPEDNLLSGTLYTKDMTATGSVYVLAVVDGNVGLYQDKLTDGVFRNYANKTYLALTASTAASYSFNFDWAGTTGVEGVVAEGAENGAIYDITGRRVKAIKAPGLYIINGVKVVK